MNSLVKVSPYSKLNFQGKYFFPQNWCNITFRTALNFHTAPKFAFLLSITFSHDMDIWSQASYRYPILWEAFFEPSDSYFLFSEERGYHRWALAHSSSCFSWRSVTENFNFISCENVILRRKTNFGAVWKFNAVWSLWPYIRSLPSIVAEKNVMKNVHICSMCIETN
jgi:hypothetical protein